MADWRQIQARIRKARASTNAAEQLEELHQRTHDAMVAFELARWQEKAGNNPEAIKWYTEAAARFRREQWRVKAEEALTRLGAPIPPRAPDVVAGEDGAPVEAAETSTGVLVGEVIAPDESPIDESSLEETEEKVAEAESMGVVVTAGGSDSTSDSTSEAASEAAGDGTAAGKKRRRRGRRGGRNRRREGSRTGTAATAGTASASAGASTAAAPGAAKDREPARAFSSSQTASVSSAGPSYVRGAYRPAAVPTETADQASARSYEAREASREAESVRPSAGGSWQGRARAGEPALASRLALLESQLRRLLSCPMASLDDADQAPAGPGVLVLSDSDQVTHYYIEACQTLRIGIGNLLRGGRGSKSGGELKQLMAKNLGIVESRVPKYLKDHCAVRWLQLDEGAPELAHFAMAVLRPVVAD